MITGIRSLCYGLGPALFGFVFYLFHVDVEKADVVIPKPVAHNVSRQNGDFSILRQINEVHYSVFCCPVLLYVLCVICSLSSCCVILSHWRTAINILQVTSGKAAFPERELLDIVGVQKLQIQN